MTEPLFREDAYWREVEARVIAAGPNGIVLDGTVFCPRGGGQSGDRGRFVLADHSSDRFIDTLYAPTGAPFCTCPPRARGFPWPAKASSQGSTGTCALSACAPTARCTS